MTKEPKIKSVYVSEVWSVYADPKTGEVYYDVVVDGQNIHVVMSMSEALHLHDKEHIKKQYIKYIKTL